MDTLDPLDFSCKRIFQIEGYGSKTLPQLFFKRLEEYFCREILPFYFINKLIKVKDIKSLENVIKIVPVSIKAELEKLLSKAKEVDYGNIIIAPLYYGALRYYDGIYYRVINDNLTLCNGGVYSSEGISSLGFALYTDNLLKILED